MKSGELFKVFAGVLAVYVVLTWLKNGGSFSYNPLNSTISHAPFYPPGGAPTGQTSPGYSGTGILV